MSEETRKKVVLRQVAARAGVSLGTASNVFAGRRGVSQKAREAVLKAADELGYHPAPRTPEPATKTLGFLLRSALEIPLPINQFYSYVLSGAEQACTERGLSLLYGTLDAETKSMTAMPAMIQRRQIDGLLVVGYFSTECFTLLRDTGIPFVMVDQSDAAFEVDSVVSDNERGGYLATTYLLQHVPHPIPAMIMGLPNRSSFYERWLGYRRALAEYSLPYDERYVCQVKSAAEEGYHAMKTLLDLPKPPNAIFCSNDQAAIGALNALHERGIAVPDECSIIGFDDIDMAAHTTPPLTTIRVDKALLGAEGVRLLLDRLAHPEMAARRTTISVKLIERESVSISKA